MVGLHAGHLTVVVAAQGKQAGDGLGNCAGVGTARCLLTAFHIRTRQPELDGTRTFHMLPHQNVQTLSWAPAADTFVLNYFCKKNVGTVAC